MLKKLVGLPALSFGKDFLGAISGLGGGVFIVPALIIIARMPMRIGVGASLISVVSTSAGASVALVRDGSTYLRSRWCWNAPLSLVRSGAHSSPAVVPVVVPELLFAGA